MSPTAHDVDRPCRCPELRVQWTQLHCPAARSFALLLLRIDSRRCRHLDSGSRHGPPPRDPITNDTAGFKPYLGHVPPVSGYRLQPSPWAGDLSPPQLPRHISYLFAPMSSRDRAPRHRHRRIARQASSLQGRRLDFGDTACLVHAALDTGDLGFTACAAICYLLTDNGGTKPSSESDHGLLLELQ